MCLVLVSFWNGSKCITLDECGTEVICDYGGVVYSVGVQFFGTGIDWCNSCGCEVNGMVFCTE